MSFSSHTGSTELGALVSTLMSGKSGKIVKPSLNLAQNTVDGDPTASWLQ